LQESEEKLRTALITLGDARVMLIKLADVVQQARTSLAMSEEKKGPFLLATENIFVPVANRLGIWCFKAELEDLCFKVCCGNLRRADTPHNCLILILCIDLFML
jgi:(p)ppGpp synthase/HD superfamily hydrolase